MRILPIGACVVIALAFAATAGAGKRDYAGDVEPTGDIELTAKIRHGEVKRVVELQFEDATATCDASQVPFPGFGSDLKVNARREFRATIFEDDAGGKTKISGKFRRDLKTVKGTISVSGPFEPYSNCEADDAWSASR
jgi:hypothetical protein